jgi:predicted negative regulator of RcsB-dependent stress response
MAKPISRKRSVEEPPEILSLQLRLLQYLQDNWRWVTFGLVLLFVGLGVWGVIKHMQARKNEDAGAAMAKITPLLSKAGSGPEALKALEQLLKDYPGTAPAQEAAIFRAHLLYQTKNYPEAAKAYEALRHSNLSGFDALAAESLSYCYEAQGEVRKAAEVLKTVADKITGPLQNEVYVRLALLLEQAGEAKDAGQYWQKLLEKSPDPALAPYFREKAAASADAK